MIAQTARDEAPHGRSRWFRRRCAAALTHPVTLGSLALFVLNDLALNRVNPESGIAEQVTAEASAVAGAFERKAAGDTNGAIADWINAQGFTTCTDRLFTAHAVKDMLNTRFYAGVVSYKGNEYPGRHAGLADEDLYERVQQRRRRDRRPRRQDAVAGPVVIGSGRQRGFGLCVPLDRRD